MMSCLQLTLLVLIILQHSAASRMKLLSNRKVIVDMTSNKLTRQQDGTMGLWSYHGVAAESHADRTAFTYNADLLTVDGLHHVSIASTVYPQVGINSDQDPIYQEYLLLQARAAGIDGVILEWGYMNHSSNIALWKLLDRVRKFGTLFYLGINWCDHWLTTEMKDSTSSHIVEAFHSNLQYLVDNVFILGPDIILYHGNHPIIFLFGGGLSSQQFQDLLSKPLNLPVGMDTPVWIGSYLNFASSPMKWKEWSGLVNGSFGWVPFIERPTPADMSDWDYYGTLEDAVQYQKNVSTFGKSCMTQKTCVMWCGSASPGFDNRGCAGWGRKLRYLPRWQHQRSTYEAQWEFYVHLASSPDVIIIPTLNDFLEATPILATNPMSSALNTTAYYTAKWKNTPMNHVGLHLPTEWFQMYKEAAYYEQTPNLNVTSIISSLEAVAFLLNEQLYNTAVASLANIRMNLQSLQSKLKVVNMTLDLSNKLMYPTIKPLVSSGSYYIDKKNGLFLAAIEDVAVLLRRSNYKALLRFNYNLQAGNFSHLRVYSSSSRQSRRDEEVYRPKYQSHNHREGLLVTLGNFAEVCDLMVTESDRWQSAVVALHKVNQAWDQTGQHSSDVYFVTDSSFLLRNISLHFNIISLQQTSHNGRYN